ncbi:MAG: HAMP domain-containing sensor histidine kinase [Actinomycetota bacterium]|nr:HAMP domain-containing sensor histidine kinase [Actinomycetota bacterium]
MRAVLASVAAVLGGLALFEITMQPSSSERVELGVIFVVMGVTSALAAVFLPIMARRSRRLITTLFALSLVSLVIAAFGLVVTANRMFFSEHDLILLLVVLGFGLFASLGFALSASTTLSEDLLRMKDTTREVARGDLGARTQVERADEIGQLAQGINEMAERLEEASSARLREEARRRQFFASVGHDLRTPLTSAQVAVEALRDGVAPDPERYYASLQQDLHALNSLVDDLFLLARIQSGDIVFETMSTDITDVADEAIEVLLPVATKRDVALVLDAPSRVVIDTSPEAVSRVLRNLLDNAVRHAPSGSAVRVEVTDGDGAVISVRDDGPGFSREFIGEAFESFSRSDPARDRETGGAGLGLAIAEAFVEALDGEIWADLGPGGTVTFHLPNRSFVRQE